MSVITHALIYSSQENDCFLIDLTPIIRPDVKWKNCFKQIDMEGAGGSKHFVEYVYAAAFNHINPDKLIEWFQTCEINGDAIMILTREDTPYADSMQVIKKES